MRIDGFGNIAQPSSFIQYGNFLWGYFLYHISFYVPSFIDLLTYSLVTIFVLLIIFLSLIYFSFQIIGDDFKKKIVTFCLFFTVLAYPLVFPQFTMNSGLLTTSAIIGGLAYAQTKKIHNLILASILAFLGYLIRDNQFFLMIIIGAPFLPVKKLLKDKACLIAISLLASLIAFSIIIHHKNYSTAQWAKFNNFQQERTYWIDYHGFEYLSDKPSIYEKHGYSANDLSLIGNWFFADNSLIDYKRLHAMKSEFKKQRDISNKIKNGKRGVTSLLNPNVLPLLLAIILFFAITPNWQTVISLMVAVSAFFYMGFIGRPGIMRVYYPVLSLISFMSFLLILTPHIKKDGTFKLLSLMFYQVCKMLANMKQLLVNQYKKYGIRFIITPILIILTLCTLVSYQHEFLTKITHNAALLTAAGIIGILVYAHTQKLHILVFSSMLTVFGLFIQCQLFLLTLIIGTIFLPLSKLIKDKAFIIIILSSILIAISMSINNTISNKHSYADTNSELIKPIPIASNLLSNSKTNLLIKYESTRNHIYKENIENGLQSIKKLFKTFALAFFIPIILSMLVYPNRKTFFSLIFAMFIFFYLGYIGTPVRISTVYGPILGLILFATIFNKPNLIPYSEASRLLSGYLSKVSIPTYKLQSRKYLVICLFLFFMSVTYFNQIKNKHDHLVQSSNGFKPNLNLIHQYPFIVTWGAYFPYDSYYPMFRSKSNILTKNIPMYTLGTSTLNPFSIATMYENQNNGLVHQLKSDKGMLFYASDQHMELLATYCKEHHHKNLSYQVSNSSFGKKIFKARCI